jgi:hypothetical protein
MQYSRQDYLSGKVTHDEYYGQFVNKHILVCVESRVKLSRIMDSNDDAFNDIPLKIWDNFHPVVSQLAGLKNPSLSDSVCIAKRAALEIKRLNLSDFTDV